MKLTPLVLDEAGPIKEIQVAGTTNPKQLAGSIAEEMRQARTAGKAPNVSLHAIGHQAVGQAVKAVPIANTYLVSQGMILTILPSFEDKMVADQIDPSVKVNRTVMRLRLLPWQIGG